MIESFKHKGLKNFFQKGNASKIFQEHVKRLRPILTLINSAEKISDLNFPGANLHDLKGDLKGYCAVSISGNWRLVFRFKDGKIFDLDYCDYP